MAHQKEMSSPTRTYVAMCVRANFNGYYFRKFTLPEMDECRNYANNADTAAWYFLNVLDGVACIEGCLPFEDFANVKDAPTAPTLLDCEGVKP